jgi:hypothetical protein
MNVKETEHFFYKQSSGLLLFLYPTTPFEDDQTCATVPSSWIPDPDQTHCGKNETDCCCVFFVMVWQQMQCKFIKQLSCVSFLKYFTMSSSANTLSPHQRGMGGGGG